MLNFFNFEQNFARGIFVQIILHHSKIRYAKKYYKSNNIITKSTKDYNTLRSLKFVNRFHVITAKTSRKEIR